MLVTRTIEKRPQRPTSTVRVHRPFLPCQPGGRARPHTAPERISNGIGLARYDQELYPAERPSRQPSSPGMFARNRPILAIRMEADTDLNQSWVADRRQRVIRPGKRQVLSECPGVRLECDTLLIPSVGRRRRQTNEQSSELTRNGLGSRRTRNWRVLRRSGMGLAPADAMPRQDIAAYPSEPPSRRPR